MDWNRCYILHRVAMITLKQLASFFLNRRVEISKKGEVLKMMLKNLTEADSGEYMVKVGDRPCKCNVQVEGCKYDTKCALQYL